MANSQTVMLVIRSVRPNFRNNHDKVGFAVHSSFLASGFVLTATGRPAFAEDALSSSRTRDEVGIDGWNEFDSEYAFVYRNPDKGSKSVLVKCLVIDDNKLIVSAIVDGASEPAHLEIEVGNYTEESREGDYAGQFKNLDKLVKVVQREIIYKLVGGFNPNFSRTRSSSETNEEPRYYGGIGDPLGPQIHPSGVVVPPIPHGEGYSDLFPGPGAGQYPRRHAYDIGPNDRRFSSPFGGQSDFMGPPQPGVPAPGARFDPFGPPDVPGFELGRFTRQPPRRPGNGMHPDLEQFPGGSDFIQYCKPS